MQTHEAQGDGVCITRGKWSMSSNRLEGLCRQFNWTVRSLPVQSELLGAGGVKKRSFSPVLGRAQSLPCSCQLSPGFDTEVTGLSLSGM